MQQLNQVSQYRDQWKRYEVAGPLQQESLLLEPQLNCYQARPIEEHPQVYPKASASPQQQLSTDESKPVNLQHILRYLLGIAAYAM